MPNSITLDNDGTNDVFKVYSESSFDEFNVKIFNRWGTLIYQLNDINDTWDGTYKGEKVKQDSYVWRIEYKRSGSLSEKRQIKHGHVNVLR